MSWSLCVVWCNMKQSATSPHPLHTGNPYSYSQWFSSALQIGVTGGIYRLVLHDVIIMLHTMLDLLDSWIAAVELVLNMEDAGTVLLLMFRIGRFLSHLEDWVCCGKFRYSAMICRNYLKCLRSLLALVPDWHSELVLKTNLQGLFINLGVYIRPFFSNSVHATLVLFLLALNYYIHKVGSDEDSGEFSKVAPILENLLVSLSWIFLHDCCIFFSFPSLFRFTVVYTIRSLLLYWLCMFLDLAWPQG